MRRAVAMPTKFKVGNAVILKQSARQNIPGGVCVVTKVLPDRNGEREYRIKSVHEEHERAARESELISPGASESMKGR